VASDGGLRRVGIVGGPRELLRADGEQRIDPPEVRDFTNRTAAKRAPLSAERNGVREAPDAEEALRSVIVERTPEEEEKGRRGEWKGVRITMENRSPEVATRLAQDVLEEAAEEFVVLREGALQLDDNLHIRPSGDSTLPFR
jgi:hypothetical protein